MTTKPTGLPLDAAAAAPRVLSGYALVVDDTDTIRRVVVAMLERLGLRADSAEQGQQALLAVHSRNYDLVLMDCHMPVFDGYEATAAIRLWEAQEGRAALPIIALTASTLAEDRMRCTTCGMNDFLSKPINLGALREMLERWLPKRSNATVAGAPASSKTDSDLPAPAPGAIRAQPRSKAGRNATAEKHIDREQFEEMRLLIGAGFPDFVQRFQLSVHDGLTTMRDAAVALDAAALKRAAHKLKGSAGTLGIKSVAHQCAHLESLARSGNLGSATLHVETLQVTYAELCAVLEKVA